MIIRTIKKLKNLKGKTALVRVDFNVPIKNGKVVDNFRIKKSLPTIEFLLKKGAKVILVSHLGRPKAKEKKFSLKPVAKELEKTLSKKVHFICHSELVSESKEWSKKILKQVQDDSASISLLENIRFYKEEKKNTGTLAKNLSEIADLFVMDGFAVAHRASASVVGVAKYLPSYAGLLMEEEIKGLEKVIKKPKKPLVVILGGIKTETKIPVIKNLLPKANQVLIGGGIVNTYLWAKGFKVGESLIDKDFKKEILKICANKKVIIPIDLVVGDYQGKNYEVLKVSKDFKVTKGKAILSVGPATVQLYAKYIKKAQTLILNGAIGYFEQPPYQHATYAISRLFANRSKGKAFGVTGGGETVEVLKHLEVIDEVDLVSTGGGSMLEFLAGKKLPGIEILRA